MSFLAIRVIARTLAALGVLVLIGALVVPLPAGYQQRMETIHTCRDIGATSALVRASGGLPRGVTT